MGEIIMIDTVQLNDGVVCKKIVFFDIEVLPNWWSIVFRHNGKVKTVTSDYADAVEQVRNIADKYILVGYNIKGYDLKILHALIEHRTPQQLYEISQHIITKAPLHVLLQQYVSFNFWMKFHFIDLIDDFTGSLKEFEANHGMAILESSVKWDTEHLTEDEKDDLIYYNKWDVYATEQLYIKRLDYIKAKMQLAEMYNLPKLNVLKMTNAKLVATILKAKPIDRHLTVDRTYDMPLHIRPYIAKWVPAEIIDYYANTDMGKIEAYKFKDFENDGILGIGGIHSVIKKWVNVKEGKYKIYSIDVASYYPSLLILFDYMSRACHDRDLYPVIFRTRIEAKHSGNKIVADALKLVLNTTYGAMKNKYNALYDPNNASSLCITGQLLLYALSKELCQRSNCRIIQTNTDGIMVAVREKDETLMRQIVSDWEKLTGFEMEYEPIKEVYQKDVNNYVQINANGKVKIKGGFCGQADSYGGTNLDAPIVHEAIKNYLVNRTPIEKTIKSCTDVVKFCHTCKTGGTFFGTYHEIDNKMVEVTKVNRVVATLNESTGCIYKAKMVKGNVSYQKQAKISENVLRLNDDLSKYKIEDLNLDYYFYIDMAIDRLGKFYEEVS